MILVFETHATSLDNEAGLASGWFDVGLSPAGERQARELGDRRRHDDLACVYCSDLTRAVRTADIAFGDRRPELPIVRDARLPEYYGALTTWRLGSRTPGALSRVARSSSSATAPRSTRSSTC